MNFRDPTGLADSWTQTGTTAAGYPTMHYNGWVNSSSPTTTATVSNGNGYSASVRNDGLLIISGSGNWYGDGSKELVDVVATTYGQAYASEHNRLRNSLKAMPAALVNPYGNPNTGVDLDFFNPFPTLSRVLANSAMPKEQMNYILSEAAKGNYEPYVQYSANVWAMTMVQAEMSSMYYESLAAAQAKSAGQTDIFADKSLTNQTGQVDNYISGSQGNAAAQADFDALNPNNVRTYPGGTIVGDLPDGTTVNLHSSSSLGGTITLEIYNPATGMSIKIRY